MLRVFSPMVVCHTHGNYSCEREGLPPDLDAAIMTEVDLQVTTYNPSVKLTTVKEERVE